MHRRAARTLVAALFAAAILAPATAAGHSFNAPSAAEGEPLVFEAPVLELVGEFDPQSGTATEGVDFDGDPVMAGLEGIEVPTIEDEIDEPDETVRLVAPDGHEGTGTITDDDAPPALSLSDLSVPENEAAGAKLTISSPTGSTADIVIPLTSSSPGDVGVPSTVTLPAGERSVDVPLTVANDFEDELDEAITITIGTTTGGAATVADGEGVATIVNDDLRVVDVMDASTTEGADGTTSIAQFTVRLNAPTFRTVTVRFVTADGLAKAPGDYLGRLGTLTFTPGQTVQTLDVQVVGDD
ncbi:MAG: hypothetical protein M3320_10310, partial [Actinomycetota bacterium]|nr:hypothetical protein [Actinomycetota bacterium]